jgi:3-oxoacyl-[acyl-carrier-protein] synthase-3
MQTGQHAQTRGARIAGVVSCLPPRIVDNAQFEAKFGDAVAEVTKMTGVKARHYAEDGVTTSDLCEVAARKLFEKLGWAPETVDGIIFISQSPDYPLPATSCLLQDRLGLRTSVVAFDVNLGCSAYPYGLWLAMSLIQTGAMKRVLLGIGDINTRAIDPNDRATALLFGDCGTMTALEASDDGDSSAHFLLGTDGRGADNLIVPASKQRIRKAEGKWEGRNLELLYMDGGEIFNFTLKSVPPLVRETLEVAGVPMEEYDSFLMHQANTFIINHLAKKSKLPKEKVPINMDRYGNTSSATIPLLMTTDVAEQLLSGKRRLGLFGFGVGYSWASASLEVGPLQCCETVIA